MEIVAPGNGNGTEDGVELLNPPLTAPVAVRLASGEILVAGQTMVDGVPATDLEWFNSGVTNQTATPQPLPVGSGFALIALEAGGALAVVAPPPNPPAGFQTTWVIGADHVVSPALSVPGSLTSPKLFGGAEGAPLLWTGDRWLQWQPWMGQFGISPVLSATANIDDAFTSPDPGLAMWLDTTAHQLVALRVDTNNAYSSDPPSYVASSATDIAPDQLPGAPDQLPGGATVSYNGGSGVTMAYGASAFVTDRTYADVSIRVTFAAGQPPSVVLRDDQGSEHVVDATCCAGLMAAQGPSPVMDVERSGGTVTCAVAGAAASACPLPGLDAGAAVSVGVRGASQTTTSIATEIVVTRLGVP
jgi:hypothetical protein